MDSLPDIQNSNTGLGLNKSPQSLDWVGMDHITLPLSVGLTSKITIPFKIEAGVNFLSTGARGIHMSRLYQILTRDLANTNLSYELLKVILQKMIESQDGSSTLAQIEISGEIPFLRKSLLSNQEGYRVYPFKLAAKFDKNKPIQDAFKFELQFQVLYSSTCPQSAALSRQLNAQAFMNALKNNEISLSAENIEQWLLSSHGMPATPHAQRSEAVIHLEINQEFNLNTDFELLLNQIESALGTPVQTLVKRQDEQEFARRNGQNLMFCEDAARILRSQLENNHKIQAFSGVVRHFESLHAHNAVAKFSGKRQN